MLTTISKHLKFFATSVCALFPRECRGAASICEQFVPTILADSWGLRCRRRAPEQVPDTPAALLEKRAARKARRARAPGCAADSEPGAARAPWEAPRSSRLRGLCRRITTGGGRAAARLRCCWRRCSCWAWRSGTSAHPPPQRAARQRGCAARSSTCCSGPPCPLSGRGPGWRTARTTQRCVYVHVTIPVILQAAACV